MELGECGGADQAKLCMDPTTALSGRKLGTMGQCDNGGVFRAASHGMRYSGLTHRLAKMKFPLWPRGGKDGWGMIAGLRFAEGNGSC